MASPLLSLIDTYSIGVHLLDWSLPTRSELSYSIGVSLLDRSFLVAIAKEWLTGLLALYWDERSNPDVAEANGITVVLQ